MLVEKHVIGPGTIWYEDLKTKEPRKAVVTPAHVQHWHEQGNKMLALGLTVPLPCEHDFDAHPMTPADKLKNNAGWVKEYKVKEGHLFSVLDVPDEEFAKKLPTTVKYTSPWFSSFTDGNGNQWKNVIAHLALTTRPRITNQTPFPSLAAALEAATECQLPDDGCVLTQAAVLKVLDGKFFPTHPIAFSLYTGTALSMDDDEDTDDDDPEPETPKNKLADDPEEMKMEKVLCDLLAILGLPVPETTTPADFKKALYQAATSKIKELSNKPATPAATPAAPGAPGKKPAHNPLVQEQQPMYMSLEDINKIEDANLKGVALSMYNENVRLTAALEESKKGTASLQAAKLTEEGAKRKARVDKLSSKSPRVKADLDAMAALPAMALSLGDGGAVVDPMDWALSAMEKQLADIPAMLATEVTALQVVAQPTDGEMTSEEIDKLVESQSRFMGNPPAKKAS